MYIDQNGDDRHQSMLTSTDSFDSHSPSIPLFLVGPLNDIQCPHRVNESKFLLVDQHWCVHV